MKSSYKQQLKFKKVSNKLTLLKPKKTPQTVIYTLTSLILFIMNEEISFLNLGWKFALHYVINRTMCALSIESHIKDQIRNYSYKNER